MATGNLHICKAEKPADFNNMNFTKLRDVIADLAQNKTVGLPRRGIRNKLQTKTIWLKNNNLTSLKLLNVYMARIVEDASKVIWLDLAYNQLKHIDPSILTCKKLRVLYLNGNQLDNLDDAIMLSKLRHLKVLTLHGNPIYENGHDRQKLVKALPQMVLLEHAYTPCHSRKREDVEGEDNEGDVCSVCSCQLYMPMPE